MRARERIYYKSSSIHPFRHVYQAHNVLGAGKQGRMKGSLCPEGAYVLGITKFQNDGTETSKN